jgi:hypothetical protein
MDITIRICVELYSRGCNPRTMAEEWKGLIQPLKRKIRTQSKHLSNWHEGWDTPAHLAFFLLLNGQQNYDAAFPVARMEK